MNLFITRLKNLLRHRYLFKIIVLCFLIISVCIICFYPFKSKYNTKETDFLGIVIKYKIDGDKLVINLKGKEKLIVNYYFTSLKEKEYYLNNLNFGDELLIKGKLEVPSNNTIPNSFNYKKYLYNKKIYYLLKASKLEISKKNESIFYHIKNLMLKRISKYKSSSYLSVFLLGDTSFIDVSVMSSYREIGVSHLFSISGMHISLLTSILLFVLKKISYNNRFNYFLVILFLVFYMLLIGVPSSVLRTTVMFVIFALNNSFNLKIKSIDLMFIVLSICLIINPFLLVDIGFQYSYLISFSLVLFSKKIREKKSYLKRSLYISWISFLISFPITIINFYQINIIGVFINLLMIPLVSIIIFPLSLLTFIFPYLDSLLFFSVNLLERIALFMNSIDITKIIFSKVNIFIILIYYLFIYLSLFNKKYLSLLIVLVFLHKVSVYFIPFMNITMLDVGQGDAILIDYPYNKGTVLIDTGGITSFKVDKWREKKSNYSISNNIITYLHSIGKTKIDYLVISHGDFDHMGESLELVKNIKVEKVIFNCGPYNDLEKELINVLTQRKIKYYSCNKELDIDKYKLQFLNTKEYNNENDNSSVIYFNYNNYKSLFMGDAGIQREKDLLDKYNLKNIDFLKVGHHGSNTSSSEYFIDKINTKYSLISVGKNNRYGHPKEEVLNVLKKSKIYRTDLDGSIEIRLNKDKYKIITCPP